MHCYVMNAEVKYANKEEAPIPCVGRIQRHGGSAWKETGSRDEAEKTLESCALAASLLLAYWGS